MESLDRPQGQASLISVTSSTNWSGYDWNDERKEHEMVVRAAEAGETAKADVLTRRHLERLITLGQSFPEQAGRN